MCVVSKVLHWKLMYFKRYSETHQNVIETLLKEKFQNLIDAMKYLQQF